MAANPLEWRAAPSLTGPITELRTWPQSTYLSAPRVDDADGPTSEHVEGALEHDDRRAFIETDANQARMIPDDRNERRQTAALGKVRRDDCLGPQSKTRDGCR